MNICSGYDKGYHRPLSLYVRFKVCCVDWPYRGWSDAGIISNIVIMATAPILGFRPQAGFVDWVLVIALLC